MIPETSRRPPQRARAATRRSQEERTLHTRAKVLDAAVECLHRTGFTATTTAAVAKAAGVSRGAMLHHFPSKDDLLLAMVERVFEQSLADYSAKLAAIADPVAKLLAMPELAWEGMQSPGYMAWIEVWMATRGRDELSRRFGLAYEAINERAARQIRALARQAGVTDMKRVDNLRTLFLAAMRGLAIEGAISGKPERFTAAALEMRRLLELALMPDGNRPAQKRPRARS
jgi:AcrR family transcriptional regulator